MSGTFTKIIAILTAAVMLLPMAACSIFTPKYSLSGIKLEESETSWSNPDEKYAELLEKYGSSTCVGTMAVATDKDIVYLYCEDAVEKDGTTRVSQNTVFDAASMSKVMTAVCILQLQEKGKLSIYDTLDKYFPEYETGKDITLYNLLHMNSGISDYLNNPDPFWNISGAEAADKQLSELYLDETTDEELLAAMYKAPLEFETGTKTSYSNTNYRLLAFVIEQITGMDYCDYVQKNIFDKCGMTNSSSMKTGDLTYVPGDFEELVKYGFCDEDGYPACPRNSRGDGGIHSCLTDMLSFDRALFGGKLLSKESMEILLHDEAAYCCGLRLDANGWSHDGSSLTCSGNNRIIKSEEFGHIYIINFMHSGSSDSYDSIYAPMAGTCYTRGVFENYVYTNKCADLKINFPDSYYAMTESNIEPARNMAIADAISDKWKAIESARTWDAVLLGMYDIFDISFLNTRLAFPDDPDYTVDEYLDDWVEDEVTAVPDYGYDVEVKERTTAKLGGYEYVRQHIILSNSGEKGDIYEYARKLDDDLMCLVGIPCWEDITIDFYEAWFE